MFPKNIIKQRMNWLLTALGAISIALGVGAFTEVKVRQTKPAQEVGAVTTAKPTIYVYAEDQKNGWTSNSYFSVWDNGTVQNLTMVITACSFADGSGYSSIDQIPTDKVLVGGQSDSAYVYRTTYNGSSALYVEMIAVGWGTDVYHWKYELPWIFSSITYTYICTTMTNRVISAGTGYNVAHSNANAYNDYIYHNNVSGDNVYFYLNSVSTSAYSDDVASMAITYYRGSNVIGTDSPLWWTYYSALTIALTGFDFNGWYTNSSLTTAYSTQMIHSSTFSIYGSYSSNSYAVTEYEVVNGTLNNTPIATEYAPISSNFTPTGIAKSGYALIGWYTDSACSTAYTAKTWTAAGNLYAKYSQQYTVTEYAVIGGAKQPNPIKTETATYNVGFTPTGAITGFSVSWYTNEGLTTTYTSGSKLTANTTLYGKFVSSAPAQFTLNLATFIATNPDGCYADNWETAYTVYYHAWNATYSTGLTWMGTRSTTNGTFSITISSSWTGILFCIDSTYPSANGTSYWRQSADVDLSSMSITNGSKLYLSMAGSTTNTVRSAVTRVNNYSTVNDTTRAVYIRKDYSPSTGFSYLVVRCWKKASPSTDTYLTSGKLVSGSTNLYYFYLAANYDAFAFLAVVGSAASNNWIYSGIREYSFNPIDSTTGAIKLVLAVSATPTTSSTATCTWMSNEQVTETSSSYTSLPIKPGYFRVWLARPSLGFGSSTAYESGYLWTAKVINSTSGYTYEVVPHGYVIDDMWVGTGSSQRVLAFYDIHTSAYKGSTFGFICRPDGVTSTTAVQTYSSTTTYTSEGNSKIYNLVYASSTLTCTKIACEYSSMTLLKTVMSGYLSCEASP